MIPVLTIIGLQAGDLLAGAVIIENVFYLPGIGRLVFEAIGQRDLPVIQGVVLLIATMIVVMNFVIDVAYRYLDPRIRYEYKGNEPSSTFRNINFFIGFAITGVILFTAVLSVVHTPYDPNRMNLSARFQAPTAHWFGTDQYGRDIFSRVMKGSINSIIVGLVAVSIGMGFGILLGSLAAFYKGWMDEIDHETVGCALWVPSGSECHPHYLDSGTWD